MYTPEQTPRRSRWAATSIAALVVLGIFSFIPLLNQLERMTVSGVKGTSARSTLRKAPEVNPQTKETTTLIVGQEFEEKDVTPVGWIQNTRIHSEEPRVAAMPVLEERQVASKLETVFVFNVEDLDYTPTPVYRKRPLYPFELAQTGVEGRVVAEFHVDSDGRTRQIKIVSTDHPKFSAAVVEALLLWRFMPGMVDGEEVEFRMRIPMVFQLKQGGGTDPELHIAAID